MPDLVKIHVVGDAIPSHIPLQSNLQIKRVVGSGPSAISGRDLSSEVALITDGRFSGGSRGFVIGHITPEAFDGGPIALIEDGDSISIDAESQLITLDIDDAEMKKRRSRWKQPAPYTDRGVLAKYARLVSSASEGAVTDLL